jgi:hypothetical protein
MEAVTFPQQGFLVLSRAIGDKPAQAAQWSLGNGGKMTHWHFRPAQVYEVLRIAVSYAAALVLGA